MRLAWKSWLCEHLSPPLSTNNKWISPPTEHQLSGENTRDFPCSGWPGWLEWARVGNEGVWKAVLITYDKCALHGTFPPVFLCPSNPPSPSEHLFPLVAAVHFNSSLHNLLSMRIFSWPSCQFYYPSCALYRTVGPGTKEPFLHQHLCSGSA